MGDESSVPVITIAKLQSNSDEKDSYQATRYLTVEGASKTENRAPTICMLFLPLDRHKVVPIGYIR